MQFDNIIYNCKEGRKGKRRKVYKIVIKCIKLSLLLIHSSKKNNMKNNKYNTVGT
jgi:hypothetical protein